MFTREQVEKLIKIVERNPRRSWVKCRQCLDDGILYFIVQAPKPFSYWYSVGFRCTCDAGKRYDVPGHAFNALWYNGAIELPKSGATCVMRNEDTAQEFNSVQTVVMELAMNNRRVRDFTYKKSGRIPHIEPILNHIPQEWLDYFEWRIDDEQAGLVGGADTRRIHGEDQGKGEVQTERPDGLATEKLQESSQEIPF